MSGVDPLDRYQFSCNPEGDGWGVILIRVPCTGNVPLHLRGLEALRAILQLSRDFHVMEQKIIDETPGLRETLNTLAAGPAMGQVGPMGPKGSN